MDWPDFKEHGLLITVVARLCAWYVLPRVRGLYIRRRPLDKIRRELFFRAISGSPLPEPVRKLYAESCNKMIPLFEAVTPDELEHGFEQLVTEYGLDKDVHLRYLRELGTRYAFEVRTHPRADKLELDATVFKDLCQRDVLNPLGRPWEKRVEKPRPGDRKSYLYRMLAEEREYEGQWDEALKWVEKAYTEAGQDPIEQAKILNKRAVLLFNLGEYEMAKEDAREALALSIHSKQLERALYGLNGLIAWILMYEGDYRGAGERFKGLEAHHFLGRVAFEQRRYEEALSHFETDRKKLKDRRPYLSYESFLVGQAFNDRWLANTYYRLKERKKAQWHWRAAEEVFTSIKMGVVAPHYATAHLLRDRGLVLLSSQNFDKAVDLFEQARETWKQQRYLRGTLENTILLAEAYVRLRDRQKALKELEFFVSVGEPMKTTVLWSRARRLQEGLRKR